MTSEPSIRHASKRRSCLMETTMKRKSYKTPKSLPKPGNLYLLKTGGVAVTVTVQEAGWGGIWGSKGAVVKLWRVTVIDEGGMLSFLWDETYASYWQLIASVGDLNEETS